MGFFSGGRGVKREADRSPPSPEVKNVWSYTSTPPVVFMAWCLVKHRDDFTLHHRVRMVLGPTQPPIQWVPGALSLGVKRPGHEANRSPPSSAEVKEWVELYLHSPNTPESDAASPHLPTPFSPKIHFSIIFPPTPRSPEWSLPFRFSDQNIVCVSHLYFNA
jgi:hypothetical protein